MWWGVRRARRAATRRASRDEVHSRWGSRLRVRGGEGVAQPMTSSSCTSRQGGPCTSRSPHRVARAPSRRVREQLPDEAQKVLSPASRALGFAPRSSSKAASRSVHAPALGCLVESGPAVLVGGEATVPVTADRVVTFTDPAGTSSSAAVFMIRSGDRTTRTVIPIRMAMGTRIYRTDDSVNDGGSVKTEVTPKETEVFVDGYYAGVAEDFDGTFQRVIRRGEATPSRSISKAIERSRRTFTFGRTRR